MSITDEFDGTECYSQKTDPSIPSGFIVIGRCSKCGGRVVARKYPYVDSSGHIVDDSYCMACCSVKKKQIFKNYLPVIEME